MIHSVYSRILILKKKKTKNTDQIRNHPGLSPFGGVDIRAAYLFCMAVHMFVVYLHLNSLYQNIIRHRRTWRATLFSPPSDGLWASGGAKK